jgi:hypothetical protein
MYPFSVRYVWKLDSWTNILLIFGLVLKPGMSNRVPWGCAPGHIGTGTAQCQVQAWTPDRLVRPRLCPVHLDVVDAQQRVEGVSLRPSVGALQKGNNTPIQCLQHRRLLCLCHLTLPAPTPVPPTLTPPPAPPALTPPALMPPRA